MIFKAYTLAFLITAGKPMKGEIVILLSSGISDMSLCCLINIVWEKAWKGTAAQPRTVIWLFLYLHVQSLENANTGGRTEYAWQIISHHSNHLRFEISSCLRSLPLAKDPLPLEKDFTFGRTEPEDTSWHINVPRQWDQRRKVGKCSNPTSFLCILTAYGHSTTDLYVRYICSVHPHYTE